MLLVNGQGSAQHLGYTPIYFQKKASSASQAGLKTAKPTINGAALAVNMVTVTGTANTSSNCHADCYIYLRVKEIAHRKYGWEIRIQGSGTNTSPSVMYGHVQPL